jgi:hypothetical protein
MAEAATTEFVIRLDGLSIPDKQARRINARLQAAFLEEVAQLDLADNLVFRFPKEWYGIWVDDVRRLKLPEIPHVRTGIGH